MKTLLLHVCCAPCFVGSFEAVKDKFKIFVDFYNPNIQPEPEYEHRQNELIRLIEEVKEYQEVEVLPASYQKEDWNKLVKGHEQDKEGGERCRKCFKQRLCYTAKLAKEYGIDNFATTLTISPLKNSELINSIGKEAALDAKTNYFPSDFKKNNGFQKSCELSKKYNLYRQNYCGCLFSKNR